MSLSKLFLSMCLWLLCEPLAAASFEEALHVAEGYRERGQIHLAIESLQALQEQAGSPAQRARRAGALGHAYYLERQPDRLPEARKLLEQAATAPELGAGERGRYANLLGNVYLEGREDGDRETAAAWYRRALQFDGGSPRFALGVRLNQARLLPEGEQLAALTTLSGEISALPDSIEHTRLLLALGKQARRLSGPALELTFTSLDRAIAAARSQGEKRLLSEALGALGLVYEEQQRVDEALRLTGNALREAQDGQDHSLLWPLDAQLGRLLRQQGKTAEAVQAYRRAVRHIEAVRQDIPVSYDVEGRSSFRDKLAPIYLALADLLLLQHSDPSAASTPDGQILLRETRDAVELAKQAELEDFLGDRCLIQSIRSNQADVANAGTAVLYPVVLPDRLELLLDLRGSLRRYRVEVAGDVLNMAAKRLADDLRRGRGQYKERAKQLYDWLIAPLETELRSAGIRTLLTVPDESLRLIPMAVLYDGEHYLIERHALAVSPALTVLSSVRGARPPVQMLLAGISKSVRGQDELPGVKLEVDELNRHFDSVLLLDEEFTTRQFTRRLAEGIHSIVHIASHGEFGGTADKTFVMAYDDNLRFTELESQLKSPSQRKTPLDVLAFSACQTAKGNDRAPLGLSGMAIRARAHSVIGTLWRVADDAAQPIMNAFYRNLVDSGMSKAEALRQAQLGVLRNPEMNHPFFWSPFILVGDWL